MRGKPQSSEAKKKPVQAGARKQPTKLPTQHLASPATNTNSLSHRASSRPTTSAAASSQDMAAIVTGGDSGIGRAVAVLFAREGADVAIVYLSEHEDARGDASAASRTKAAAASLHRRRREGSGVLRGSRRARPSRSSAGSTSWSTTPPSSCTPTRSRTSAKSTCRKRCRPTSAATSTWRARRCRTCRKAASIINCGSETALFGSKQLLDYSATKGAIHAFTKSLASNLLERGIRVNAVAPGPVWTPFNPADTPGGEGRGVRQEERHGPARAAGGDLAGVRVPRLAGDARRTSTASILPVMGGPRG